MGVEILVRGETNTDWDSTAGQRARLTLGTLGSRGGSDTGFLACC